MTDNVEQKELSEKDNLRNTVFTILQDILSNPDNLLAIHLSAAKTQVQALEQLMTASRNKSGRPVVTRVPYPGCVMAKVEDAEDGNLKAVLFEYKDDGEHILIEDYPGYSTLEKMVLSQAVQSGDTWYITTAKSVEDVLEKSVAAMQARAFGEESADLAAAPTTDTVQ